MPDPVPPQVIATKLQIPAAHRQVVSREPVSRTLEAAAELPLTILCAPAGYGKTTTVVEWLASGRRSAWLTFDLGDNDPRRLCAHLVASLEKALPGAFAAAGSAVTEAPDLLAAVLPLILNPLAADPGAQGLALVLDDCHLLEEPRCHELLLGLLDGLPGGVRMIVAGRTAPPLRIARRRAEGSVCEIGAGELLFDDAETAMLLNESLGLGLTDHQLGMIQENLGGWPAGVALVASSLPGHPGRDEFLAALKLAEPKIDEYLTEEVLDRCRPRLRDFLLRTSILNRMQGALCAAVLDDAEAGALLGEVRRSNLFVTELNAQAGWVRYHDQFAGLLRRELREREPELIPILHDRASRWYERAGLWEESIEHASRAGDGHRAAALVHASGEALLHDRHYASVCRLIDAIPADRGEFGPYCAALKAAAEGLDGAAPPSIYEQLSKLKADYGAPGVARLVGRALIWPFFGRVAETAREGRRFFEAAAGEALPERAAIAANLGLVLWFDRAPAEARSLLEGHLDAMTGHHRGWALAVLSFLAAEEDRLDVAAARAEAAVGHAEGSGGEVGPEQTIAHQALANVLRSSGRHDEADRVLTQTAAVTDQVPGSLHHAFTLLLRAELELARRRRHLGRRAAADARAIVDRYPDPGILETRLGAVEAILEGRADDHLLGSRPTPSEQLVLELLDSDLTLEAIAQERLFLSVNTVKSHARRLYRRLGVRSRAAAVATARERGLI
jgi:LuxR family maltose regulon positive regulatory protein